MSTETKRKSEIFAQRLKNMRAREGWNQQALAAILEVPYSRIANWETARNLPRVEMMKKISEKLKCSVESLTEPLASGPRVEHVDWRDRAIRLESRLDAVRRLLAEPVGPAAAAANLQCPVCAPGAAPPPYCGVGDVPGAPLSSSAPECDTETRKRSDLIHQELKKFSEAERLRKSNLAKS